MAAIQLHNRMGDSTLLHAGDVLSIPPPTGWEGSSPFWVVHVVQAGETLVGISQHYGLEVETLQTVNGLAEGDILSIGQELVLPLNAPAEVHAPEPTSTPLPPPAPTATAPSPPPTVAPPPPPPATATAWSQEVVRLINEVRAANGLPPLAYNETLATAAQGQANDCAARGWCSHTGSDGADLRTRLVRAGYDPTGWAECWVQSLTPQDAVDWWMNEVPPNDPHRRTLLTTWLTEVGVGIAPAGWGSYFVADFGLP